MQVNMLEAKNQLSRLVKAAQAGEEVIIANHGAPAVRLVPVRTNADMRSLAEEMSELRTLMAEARLSSLDLPERSDRPNAFLDGMPDQHAAG
jgi:prevent-host-death family protein